MKSVSKTAFFCCGARMVDAESRYPVCGDNYAKNFMDREGCEVFYRFRGFKNAIIANATRHRIIDDLLRKEIAETRDVKIFIIGSGFDTRAYRMTGGVWHELDDPDILDHKEKYLPRHECRNELARIPFDFTKQTLESVLSDYHTDEKTIVIVEGVFIYLNESETLNLINTLQDIFPKHKLFCDLQTFAFYRKFNIKFQDVLKEFGTSLKISSGFPQQIFNEKGYVIEIKIPIIDKTLELAKLTLPQLFMKFLMNTIFIKVKNGYSVYTFRYNEMKGPDRTPCS